MSTGRECGTNMLLGAVNKRMAHTKVSMYEIQKKYFRTSKGKRALKKARKTYDNSDPERRRKQKREYMRRKRQENPEIWR